MVRKETSEVKSPNECFSVDWSAMKRDKERSSEIELIPSLSHMEMTEKDQAELDPKAIAIKEIVAEEAEKTQVIYEDKENNGSDKILEVTGTNVGMIREQ